MKRVIALLVCLVMIVCCFAACGDETPEEVHSHTYSEAWSSDAEGHWYAPTCECEDAPNTKLAHADKNNDGVCDVCEYKVACADGHTYSEDWTVDCTNHWNAADCGHVVPGANIAAHTDTNADGKCDVCGYVIEDIHDHYFDTTWTGDEQYHWHAALCEHGVEVADKAAHVLNAAGYCTVCDAKLADVDLADIEAVLAAAADMNGKVTNGSVDYTYTIPDLDYVQNHSVYFVLGNGSTYVKRIQYGEANEFWYEYIDEDEVFGVTSYDGGITLEATSADVGTLDGYTYMPSTLADATTLDGILSALYELSKADTAKDVVVNYDADTGVYSFSYEYLSVNVITGSGSMEDSGNDNSTAESITNVETRLFTVEAQFEINDDFVITSAEFAVGAYNQDIDGDYVYNVEDGTYTMSDTALADTYAYKVAQGSGDRKYYTAYPKASLVPNAFDLSYNGTVIEDTVTVEKGTYTQLALVNIKPFSAYVDMISSDDVTVSIVDKATSEAAGFSGYYSSWSGAVCFNPNTVGEYTVTVTYGELEIEFTLVVNPVAPQYLTLHPIYENSGWGDTWLEADASVTATEIELAVGETYDFLVMVNPSAAEQGYTVTVDSDNATISDATIGGCIIFYSPMDSCTVKQFKSDVAGTYTITLTSEADPTVTSTVIVNVIDPSLVIPIVGKTYNAYVDAEPLGGVVYITGETGSSSWYLATSADAAEAAAVCVEAVDGVEGGYYLYFMDGETKKYIEAYERTAGEAGKGKGSIQIIETTPTSYYTYDATYNTLIVTSGDGFNKYYIGTYTNASNGVTYETLSCSNYSYLSADNVEVTQFPMHFVELAGESVTLEGEGTESSPYILPAAGDYTCAFPGGWSPVWYNLAIEEGGYVTVSSDFTGTPWIMLGTGTMAYTSNEGQSNTMSAYFPAGTTAWIAVGDWDEAAVDVPFNVAFEAVTSDPIDELVGSWSATSSTTWGGSVTYALTINADGTGSFSYDEGYGVTDATLDYVLVDGETVLLGYTARWSSGALNCTYIDGTFACSQGIYYESFEFTKGDATGGDSGNDESGANELTIGPNQIEAADVTYTYTATEAGKLTLEATGAVMGMVEISYTVNGGDSQVLELSSSVELDLAAGDVVVITVTAEGYSTIKANWTAGTVEE